ncbi:DedA family protein [Patescibacteria group bacterium]|nr:DedA family protein [Patescibacteria group bacterium]
MLESLTGIIIHLISQAGYLGVYILMTLESALIPVPSEVTLPFAGFLSDKGSLLFTFVVIAGILGDLTGALISYAIGYFLQENILLNLIKKYGKFILVTQDDYERAMRWFNNYGSKVVFFSRLIPGLRTYISLPAGISRMKLVRFVSYTVAGSTIWVICLTYIGFYLGSKWDTIGGYFRKFDLVIVVLIIVAALAYINHKLKIIKFKKN